MRDIKFRAWDKAYNKMILPEQADRYWINFFGNTKEFDTWANEVILMQYTGLNDKNGKPIYEGDVVFLETLLMEKGIRSVVEWNETEGWVDSGTKTQISWGTRQRLNDILSVYEWEVIGNKFENPELLKD